MLELLNQLDGFDSRGDVKVILATNRIESLDPAILVLLGWATESVPVDIDLGKEGHGNAIS
ncbi:hypothetical protein JHK82_022780 [Glycine max]|nr:hypothetical protein JHK82_022780 [Glycine max]